MHAVAQVSVVGQNMADFADKLPAICTGKKVLVNFMDPPQFLEWAERYGAACTALGGRLLPLTDAGAVAMFKTFSNNEVQNHHIWTISHAVSAPLHPDHAVCCALLGASADRAPIGAWNDSSDAVTGLFAAACMTHRRPSRRTWSRATRATPSSNLRRHRCPTHSPASPLPLRGCAEESD